MTQRVTDLWTGYERHAGLWYAMYCNVDLDQSERNKRDDIVWVRNSEVATARSEIASLRAKLEAVCEAGEVMRCDVICDTSSAAECPRGDCDCDGCDSVRVFLAAIALPLFEPQAQPSLLSPPIPIKGTLL